MYVCITYVCMYDIGGLDGRLRRRLLARVLGARPRPYAILINGCK